ncbi:hypothetical protein GGX14DRAFT_394863 [Mycena pura]|uniref:Uncharacterized protein n=1 Tax=Mycena pura TaxID=153505 RepID=A0AAD6YAE1_9AGAR|nr:hypothetical protein GGX14DRAFT_394863 [Mycena pura]
MFRTLVLGMNIFTAKPRLSDAIRQTGLGSPYSDLRVCRQSPTPHWHQPPEQTLAEVHTKLAWGVMSPTYTNMSQNIGSSTPGTRVLRNPFIEREYRDDRIVLSDKPMFLKRIDNFAQCCLRRRWHTIKLILTRAAAPEVSSGNSVPSRSISASNDAGVVPAPVPSIRRDADDEAAEQVTLVLELAQPDHPEANPG